MRNLLVAAAIVGMVLPSIDADARRRRRHTTKVALVPITAGDRVVARAAHKATRQLARKLRRDRRYSVRVLPARRAAKLRACLQQPSCVQAVARRYGVRYVIAAHAERVGRRLHVDMRVVSGKTGVVLASDSITTRRPGTVIARAPRMAVKLIGQANRGVQVAATSDRATDAQFTPEVITRSDAEAAAMVVEERDTEDPNAKPAEQQPEAEKLAFTPNGDAAAAKLADGASAAFVAEPQVVRQHDDSLVARLWSKRYWHAWATAGAGLAALGAGVGFGLISKGSNQDAFNAESQPQAWTLRDRARKNALLANISYAAGGAALLTSTVLFYLEYKKERRERANRGDVNVGINVARDGGMITVGGSL